MFLFGAVLRSPHASCRCRTPPHWKLFSGSWFAHAAVLGRHSIRGATRPRAEKAPTGSPPSASPVPLPRPTCPPDRLDSSASNSHLVDIPAAHGERGVARWGGPAGNFSAPAACSAAYGV